jgi:hypothetical protein
VTRHPLLQAVAVCDGLSAALILYAAWFAVQTLTIWDPASSDRFQLRLERRIETAEIGARFGLAFFSLASALMVIGICHLLPAVVPGAMCGTGVVQGSDGLLNKALLFRFVAVLVGYLWAALVRLDRFRPDSPLMLLNARFLLLAAALVAAAAVVTAEAAMALDLQQPVDCCAVVYDRLRRGPAVFAPSRPRLLWIFAVSSLAMLASAGWTAAAGPSRRVRAAAAMCAALAVWVPAAMLALAECFAAYYYQVLQHRCLWCLFLPEHHLAGYPLFAALLTAALEGPVAWAAARVGRSHPQLAAAAQRRCRSAAVRVLLAGGVFCGLAALPAVFWRLRFGVWME